MVCDLDEPEVLDALVEKAVPGKVFLERPRMGGGAERLVLQAVAHRAHRLLLAAAPTAGPADLLIPGATSLYRLPDVLVEGDEVVLGPTQRVLRTRRRALAVIVGRAYARATGGSMRRWTRRGAYALTRLRSLPAFCLLVVGAPLLACAGGPRGKCTVRAIVVWEGGTASYNAVASELGTVDPAGPCADCSEAALQRAREVALELACQELCGPIDNDNHREVHKRIRRCQAEASVDYELIDGFFLPMKKQWIRFW